MASVQVILNPAAGRGLGARTKDKLAAALKTAGLAFDLTETTHAGHATTLASEIRRQGYGVVVAAGGDGTVNEVLNGLAQATPQGELVGQLAFCPIGTGNDFADMVGAARGVDALAQRIAIGRTRVIDMARATFVSPTRELVHYFDNNMGLGFEAQVTLESYQIRRVTGPVRYILAVFKALRHYHLPMIEVTWEEAGGTWARRRQPTLLVSLGNSPRTGGVFYLTPDAVMDDGLLDLGLISNVSRVGILRVLPLVLRGGHRHHPAVFMDRCLRIEIECGEPLPVHLDGEVVMEDVLRAQVEVMPKQLEIVV